MSEAPFVYYLLIGFVNGLFWLFLTTSYGEEATGEFILAILFWPFWAIFYCVYIISIPIHLFVELVLGIKDYFRG